MRHVVAGLVAIGTLAVAVEIVVRLHRRPAHCLDVTSGGCQRWTYSGMPSWAVVATVLIGLAGGLAAALLVSQPRRARP